MKIKTFLVLSLLMGATSVYSNNSPSPFHDRSYEVWEGDYDGDGKDDLYLKAKRYTTIVKFRSIVIPLPLYKHPSYLLSNFKNNPKPTRLKQWAHNATARGARKLSYKLIIGDFNGDGLLDILFQAPNASYPTFTLYQKIRSNQQSIKHFPRVIEYLKGHGQGSEPVDVSQQGADITVVNVNGDRYDDLRIELSGRREIIAQNVQTNFFINSFHAYAEGPIVPGAIAGSSSVSELDGSYSYQMPLSLPAGPSGITPKLSISYNSSSQSGVMGHGFNISGLSVISECNAPYEADGIGGTTREIKKQLCVDGTPLVTRADGALYPESNPGTVYKLVQGGYESESLLYERKHYKKTKRIGDRGIKQWYLNRVEDPFGNGYNVTYQESNHKMPVVSTIRYNNVNIEFQYIEHPFPKKSTYHGYKVENDRILKNIKIEVASQIYRTYSFGYEKTQNFKNLRLKKVIECGADGTCIKPTTFHYERQSGIEFGFESNSRSTGGICADGSKRFGRCDSPAGDGKQKKYSSQFDGTGNHGSIQYADANGDGFLDICFRSDNHGVRCQLNDGHNRFPENNHIISTTEICDDQGKHKYEQCDDPTNFGTIRFLDFNKDGKADVVYRGDTYGLHIIPNINGKFVTEKGLVTEMCEKGGLCDNSNNFFSGQYPELNGDGIPDVCYRGDGAGIRCKISMGIHPTNKTPIYSTEITAKVFSNKVSELQVLPFHGVTDSTLRNNRERRICGHGHGGYWGGCLTDSIRFVDFDRDGLDDLIFVSGNDIKIFRSNGRVPPKTGRVGMEFQLFEPYFFSSECGEGSECRKHADTIQFVDFNNDGWLDICYEANMQQAMKQCQQTEFKEIHNNSSYPVYDMSSSHPQLNLSYLKGLQCSSLVKHDQSSERSFNITTDGIITWKREFDYEERVCEEWHEHDESGHKTCMEYGTRKKYKIVERSAEPPSVYSGRDRGFEKCTIDRQYQGRIESKPNPYGQEFASHIEAVRWMDLDYDGDLDLFVTTSPQREQYFILEDGRIINQGFLTTCQNEGGKCDYKNIRTYQFVDFNQDFSPDLVYRSKDGIRFRYGIAKNTYKLNKLTKVENGLGLVTKIRYKRLENESTQKDKKFSVSQNSLPTAGRFRLVVNEVETNTIGGASKLNYQYGEARRDTQRNKINGFSFVKVTKSVKTPTGAFQPILRTENEYAVDSHYLSGSLLSQKRFALSLNARFPGIFSQSEREISRTTNTWGLFVDRGLARHSLTNSLYRQDLYRAAIINTKTQDFGWIGHINDGRLSGSASWGPVSEVEQSSNYDATRLSGSNNQRYGHNARIYQLQGRFNGNPVAMEMQGGKRVEKDLINHKTHTIFTENEFYSGHRSRLKKTKVTKDYQRLDGTKARSVKTSAWEYYRNGQMKKEIVEPGHALSTVTEYAYDPNNGQRTKVTVKGKGIQSASTVYEYDNFLRVRKITNALGHSVQTEYDPIHGLPAKVTDANGLVTATEYDGFGRAIKTQAPNGIQSFTEYAFSTSEYSRSKYKVRTWDTLGNESEAFHAPTGQVIYSKTKTFNDQWVETLTQFDHYSQVKRTLRPRFVGDSAAHWDTVVKRDYLGAVVEAQNAAGHTVKTRRTARYVEETNAKGQKKTSVLDMKGNLYKVFDNHRNELQYLYSPDGQLLELKDVAGSHSIKMTYDKLGNKTQIDDPDKGQIKYWYNAAGQQVLSEQAGVKICQAFDKLGRTISRHDDYKGTLDQAIDGCKGTTSGITTSWHYDSAPMGGKRGKGLLHKVTDSRGYLEEYKYDALGQVIESKRRLKGKNYVERYQYDGYGRLETHTYPSGFKTENEYDGSFLTAIKNPSSGKAYWRMESMNAAGQLTQQVLGNKYHVSHQYNDTTGLLASTGANLNGRNSAGETTSQSVHVMRFEFDELGNLLQREDLKSRLKETFSYDGMNRLKSSKVYGPRNAGIPVATDAVSYFDNGNIRNKSDAGVYVYGQKNEGCRYTPGPHAISQLVNGQNVRNFCYDARGNMISDGLRRVTYAEAHDKPIHMRTNSGQTFVEFEYGPDRGRYYRKDNERGKVTETYYAGSGYEEVYENGEIRKKHYIGGNAVEIHTYKDNKRKKVEQRYLMKDHLGSIVVVGDENGNVLEHHSYDAWGKKRSLDWRRVTGLPDPSIEPKFDVDPDYEYFYGDLNGDGHTDLVKKAKTKRAFVRFRKNLIPVTIPKRVQDEVLYGDKQGLGRPRALAANTNISKLKASSVNRSWDNDSLPQNVQAHRNEATTRGFTGHEHIESLGLVHMNGRVYDPLLGRFLSADPFVQAPTNTQSPNRYSYVFNNPLSFTDPTGYLTSWGGGLFGGIFGTGPAMLGAMFPSRLGSSLAQFDYWMHTDQGLGPQLVQTGMRVVACTYGTVVGCAAAAGAMTYWLTDGDLSQGIKSAAIAFASASIADGIGDKVEKGIIDNAEAAWLHGYTQGSLAVIGAGKFSLRTFGSSFASAYVGHKMGVFEDNKAFDIFMAGSLGGVTSRIAGGSFSDGFITAAMVRIFNTHGNHDDEENTCGRYARQCLFDQLPDETKAQAREANLTLATLFIPVGSAIKGFYYSVKTFFGFKTAATVLNVPGRVASRINLMKGNSKAGMTHALKGHMSGKANKSQFTISESALRSLLQSKQVVSAPIVRTVDSASHGVLYVREVNIGRTIGTNYLQNNQPTSILTVMTNKYGNLITTYPGL